MRPGKTLPVLLAVVALAAPGRADAQDAADAPAIDGRLETYVALALARSPRAQEAGARERAARRRVGAAGRPEEPMVEYSYTRNIPGMEMPPHRLGVRQRVPVSRRLRAEREMADAEASMATAEREAEALAIRGEVADRYYRLWAIRATRALMEAQRDALGAVVEAAQARVTAGGTVAEVVRARVSFERMRDDVAGLGPAERRAEATLRAAIGATTATAVPTAGEPPAPADLALTSEEIRARIAAHPMARARIERARGAEASAAEARARRVSDVELGVDWLRGDGGNGAMWMAGVTLPLFAGAGSERARAEAEAGDAARAGAERFVVDAEAEAAQWVAMIDDAARRIRLYEETLAPLAAQSADASRAAYVTGDLPLESVLMAELERFDLARANVTTRAEHAAAWAMLEAMLGTELPGRSP